LASTRTASTPKPSPSDEIVELRPPAETGFSGTTRLYAVASAALIQELLKRGYTVVTRD
jgi:hypothetical protein